MRETVSVAIETSCRKGGVALGIGDKLAGRIDFDAFSRHATQLVVRLRELLRAHDLRPADVDELYVSAGPGSFTGVRVGITVARTLAQVLTNIQCVAVPTALAVAAAAEGLPWQHLGVLLDAKDELVYSQLFARDNSGRAVPAAEAAVISLKDFLSAAPRPITLIGEALEHCDLNAALSQAAGGVDRAPGELDLPTAVSVWTVGRRLSLQGKFTEYHQLLPIYARKSEAQRIWEQRHTPPSEPGSRS